MSEEQNVVEQWIELLANPPQDNFFTGGRSSYSYLTLYY